MNFILLNIGYSEANESWNWQNVCSPFARMYYIAKGEAKIIIEGKDYILKPNKLYLIPPFSLHSCVSIGEFAHYYIHFYEKTLNSESTFDKYFFPIEVETNPLQLALTQKLLEINPERTLKNIDPQFYDNPWTFSQYAKYNVTLPLHTLLETKGILYQLMSSFFVDATTKMNNKDERIVRCLQHIHENIHSSISLTKLANIAYVTEDHLIRLFKKDMDCTPIQYINTKKIETAQLLLVSSDLSIHDIATKLSVENIPYFNKLFKKHTSMTPSEYRSQFKEE